MKIGELGQLVVPEQKVRQYLLSPTHPRGKHKAAFFRAFGFRSDQWRVLAEALEAMAHACDVHQVVPFLYGTKYIVRGPLASPDGRNPWIQAVWSVKAGSAEVRLITAYAADEP
jgi:hypothetical protein